jgi:hypothetical protein
VPDPTAFTDRDNWGGSCYELAVRLAPGADAAAAVRAVWAHPDLTGCYLDNIAAPGDQRHLAPADLQLPGAAHVFGWAGTPAGRMVCATHVVESGHRGAAGRVELCLPVGALERLVPSLRHPIDGYGQNRSWREPVDVWLATVADALAGAVPFTVASTGVDVAGTDLALGADGTPPADRGVSVLVPSRRGTGAVRFPPTRWFTPW